MFVGTIHAFCLELLKSEVPEFMKYEDLNEVQQILFINRNSQQSGLMTTNDLKGQPLRRYIETSRYVEALSMLRESDLNEAAFRDVSILSGLRSYRQLLRSGGYLDYSAIMDEAIGAIEGDSNLRERLKQRIKHVIVRG